MNGLCVWLIDEGPSIIVRFWTPITLFVWSYGLISITFWNLKLVFGAGWWWGEGIFKLCPVVVCCKLAGNATESPSPVSFGKVRYQVSIYVGESLIVRTTDTNFNSNKNRKLVITSFFNIVSLLFNALLPSLHKLLYALRKKKMFFGWAASHARTASFMHITCSAIFEFFYPFVGTPLRQNTVSVLCWKSSVYFGPWYTFRPQKRRITERCSSLVLTVSGAAMVNVKVGTEELTEQLETWTVVIRRKPHLEMHAKMRVLPTETQMQLHCG